MVLVILTTFWQAYQMFLLIWKKSESKSYIACLFVLERLVKHIITAICLREPCLRCFYGREEHNKGIIGETTVIVLRTNTFFSRWNSNFRKNWFFILIAAGKYSATPSLFSETKSPRHCLSFVPWLDFSGRTKPLASHWEAWTNQAIDGKTTSRLQEQHGTRSRMIS